MSLNFSLSPESLELKQRSQDRFSSIVEKYSSSRANERQKEAIDDVWKALAELGYQGFLVPDAAGRFRGGLLASVIVMEELAAAGLHSFLPILLSMGAVIINKFGGEAIKRRILPQLVSGDLKLAIASTEAEAGFNVFDIETFAELQGDHFIVNGSKTYISGADITGYAILIVRTISLSDCFEKRLSKKKGISILLVDMKSEGIEMAPLPTRGEGVLRQFSLKFDDLKVPADQIIGEMHKGAEVMFNCFNPERTLASAMALGMSRYCLNLACDYARKRKVFGDTAIGAYQSIQHPLAEIEIRQDSIKLMIYKAADLFDNDGDLSEQAKASNSAKFLSSQLAIQAVDHAIDTFGGKGFDEDFGIIHLWESARLLKTSPISNALILNQIAEHTLKLPRSY